MTKKNPDKTKYVAADALPSALIASLFNISVPGEPAGFARHFCNGTTRMPIVLWQPAIYTNESVYQ